MIELATKVSLDGKEVLAIRALRISRKTKITLSVLTAVIGPFGRINQDPAVSEDLLFIPISSRKPH